MRSPEVFWNSCQFSLNIGATILYVCPVSVCYNSTYPYASLFSDFSNLQLFYCFSLFVSFSCISSSAMCIVNCGYCLNWCRNLQFSTSIFNNKRVLQLSLNLTVLISFRRFSAPSVNINSFAFFVHFLILSTGFFNKNYFRDSSNISYC